MTLIELFSSRLKWLRELKGLTQKEMADKIGVSQQYYGRFEKGTGQPNLEALYMIAEVLDESIDFIIGRSLNNKRSDALFEIYAETRIHRQEAEGDLTYLEELLNDPEKNHENVLKTIKSRREDIRDLRAKEERAFNRFFNYILTIPGYENEYATQEYWRDYYFNFYMEDQNKNNNEFWDDMRNV
ncbi:helix-turn-helix transcriptional regulator [Cohnella xylanilytica]|uniref:Helix-turn-helix transcriptional regulator n=1 Tax=Cohnella xylanilytica TaxID=557555 RepID=A0A841U7Y3_9BACL|nr:helix-turn-helix domain-containing protein [Cohnella xylanilytica]MBB6694373.1 helix-turn-helix transcriptional regulator [Cohnella xylanilytica]